MEVSREVMLELAQYDTFQLDDRLRPLDRRDLRSEAWLKGYEFAMAHPFVSADQQEAQLTLEALRSENKALREELKGRDNTIEDLQQMPEPREPVCGDIVQVFSTNDYTIAPILALWYKEGRNEQRKQCFNFITMDGQKFNRLSNDVRLELANPDAMACEIKHYLQIKVEENKEE